MGKSNLPRRTGRTQLRFEYLSCACTDCGFRYFVGAEIPRKANMWGHEAQFILSLSECPICSHLGAVPTGINSGDYGSKTCPHRPDNCIVEASPTGDYAIVCKSCRWRLLGFSRWILEDLEKGADIDAVRRTIAERFYNARSRA